MRTSQYLLATLKETPAGAELISHQLMLRAGLIRQLGSGLYTWLPLGLSVLRKIERIVREEMNKIGALEILMPAVQPAELWQETNRWEQYGPVLLKLQDRHQRDFVFGPTHEEVVTDIARKELRSYKQLPLSVYQVQTKFRDEYRPRFGVMRAREFIMKDAYSFHLDSDSLHTTYRHMHDAYCAVFTRLGLDFRPVLADTGDIGGEFSHEFQVLAASGEDQIAYSDGSDYAANVERAEALAPSQAKPEASGKPMEQVDTPNARSIEEVCQLLKLPAEKTVKTVIVKGTESPVVILIVRGDHEVNSVKASKHPLVAEPFTLADEKDINTYLPCQPGSIGPVGLTLPILVDHSAAHAVDFVCGANEDGKHYQHVNWGRDANYLEALDLRNVVDGDPSPDGQGTLKLCRGIEVGHIFKLGDKYSKSLSATVLNEQGKATALQMGCYGMGVSRIVAAAIEQNHDQRGILWPAAMAPFQVALVPIGKKSEAVEQAAEALYQQLQQAGITVLYDDRDERPGVKFADMDLIGIPHRFVIGERGLANHEIEYKNRREEEAEMISLETALEFLQAKL